MTHGEFAHLLESLDSLSTDQMEQLRRQLDTKLAGVPPGFESLQRRLLESGLLSEIKPPITDLSAYQDRKAAPIQGEPLSETVIRERR
jgi:hypothetical protein